jgi:hypothetical protein
MPTQLIREGAQPKKIALFLQALTETIREISYVERKYKKSLAVGSDLGGLPTVCGEV